MTAAEYWQWAPDKKQWSPKQQQQQLVAICSVVQSTAERRRPLYGDDDDREQSEEFVQRWKDTHTSSSGPDHQLVHFCWGFIVNNCTSHLHHLLPPLGPSSGSLISLFLLLFRNPPPPPSLCCLAGVRIAPQQLLLRFAACRYSLLPVFRTRERKRDVNKKKKKTRWRCSERKRAITPPVVTQFIASFVW